MGEAMTASEVSCDMADLGLPTEFKPKSHACVEAELVGPATASFVVDRGNAGAKLAKFVSLQTKGSRNSAATAVKEGKIRVNGERSGANRLLSDGDCVTLHESDTQKRFPRQEVEASATSDQVQAIADARSLAKMVKDYKRADSLHAELTGLGVRIDDRSGEWHMKDGRSGPLLALGAEEVAAFRAEAAQAAVESKLAGEAERRRLRNKRKRESRVRAQHLDQGSAEGGGGDAPD